MQLLFFLCCSAPEAQTAPEFKKKPLDVEVSEFEDVTIKTKVKGDISFLVNWLDARDFVPLVYLFCNQD